MARRVLALAFTFVASIVGFSYLSPLLSRLIHPGVGPENRLTNVEGGVVCFGACSLTILLSGLLGTLIAGPRSYKVSAGLVVGLCTVMEVIVGAEVIGIEGSSAGIRTGVTIMAAAGLIGVGALSYITICLVLRRTYK